MRACLLATLLFAAPALADAPARIAVAPAGACAGEELELVPNVVARSKSSANALATAPNAVVHLTPTDVAGAAALTALAAPEVPSFAGPGACDNPGSGCVDKLVEDPDPGTGCGFPGSPCP